MRSIVGLCAQTTERWGSKFRANQGVRVMPRFWRDFWCFKASGDTENRWFPTSGWLSISIRTLCIFRMSLRDYLVWKLHSGGLIGHFIREKTIDVIESLIYLPNLKRDVVRLKRQYRTCHLAKQRKKNTNLYMHLPVPNCPWQDVRMDFVLGLSKIIRKQDFIFVVMDHFSKMAHFLPYNKIFDTSKIAQIYFNGVVKLHSFEKHLEGGWIGVNANL